MSIYSEKEFRDWYMHTSLNEYQIYRELSPVECAEEHQQEKWVASTTTDPTIADLLLNAPKLALILARLYNENKLPRDVREQLESLIVLHEPTTTNLDAQNQPQHTYYINTSNPYINSSNPSDIPTINHENRYYGEQPAV